MHKQHIMAVLYGMKKKHEFFTEINGEQFGADELLTKAMGREVMYDEAATFIGS